MFLEAVHKDVRSQGGVQCGPRESLQMRTSTPFDAKTSEFKFILCPQGKGGRSRDSADNRGEGVNFSRFCADVLYGLSLHNEKLVFLSEKWIAKFASHPRVDVSDKSTVA